MTRTQTFILTICLAGLALHTHAQKQMTLYHMPHIPQSFAINPGKIPLVDFYLGVPVASGTHIDVRNNRFSYADVQNAINDGQDDRDIGSLARQLDGEPLNLKTEIQLRALSLGARTKAGFFQVEISERIATEVQFSHDLVRLVADLQADNLRAPDRPYDLADTDFSGSYIRAYSFGYGRAVDERLSLGFRFHYLEGMAMLQTANENLALQAPNNDGSMKPMGRLQVIGAGFDAINAFDLNYLRPGNKPGNGFAVDLGFNYLLTDRLELSGSVLNLGRMSWKRDLTQVELLPESALAEAFGEEDLDGFGNGGDEVYESLTDAEGTPHQEKVRQELPVRAFAGAQLLLGDRSSVGAVLEARHTELGGTAWGFGGSLNTRLGKFIGLSFAYTYTEVEPMGLGVGASIDLGPIQVYAVTDNALAALDWKNATYASAQVGVNLVFGKLTRSEQRQHFADRRTQRQAARLADND